MSGVLTAALIAANIYGAVVNSTDGKPIVGAHIALLSDTGVVATATTDLDGTFFIPTISEGRYILKISHVAYKPYEDTIDVTGGSLKLTIRMEPGVIMMPPIDVQAARVTETDGVPFTELAKDMLSRLYTQEEPPMLFSLAPGVFSYSEDGLGFANAHINIRGFPSNRISVMINGIPVNDPESHTVYWVDYPDILSDASEIQVQRGVAASLYGVSAFGGLVNIQTFDFSSERIAEAEFGYGSFNTRKFSFRYSTGRVGDKAFYARFSKIYTDGWRERSWLNSWSYYIGSAYFTDQSATKFLIWGGPENLHYSYWGITKEEFEENPRYNPITYENEVDNFYQPHFELIHTRNLTDRLTATLTAYYIHGKGYCEQYRWDQPFSDYLLPNYIDTVGVDSNGNIVVDTVQSSDLVRRRWVNERDVGLNAQFSYRTDATQLDFGFGGMHHRGHHWGEVVWAAIWPSPDVSTLHRYYDFMMDRPFLWGFASLKHDLGPVAVISDISIQQRKYRFYNDKRDSITFDIPYTFIIPRLGISKVFNDNLSMYLSVARSEREPSARNIYDATHPYESRPLIDENGNPLIKPEKLVDFESGVTWKRGDNASVELTIYSMSFKDELVPNGALTDEGYPRLANAASSVHQGVELEAKASPFKWLRLYLSAHKAIDKIREMTIFTTSGDSSISLTYRDKVTPGFPSEKASLVAEFGSERLSGWVQLQYRGKIFVDLDNSPQYAIEPHAVINMGIEAHPTEHLTVGAKVKNIANKPYLQYGVFDIEWGEAYYFPAAPRQIFVYGKLTF